MKKVLLGILIGAAAVYGYNHLNRPAAAAAATTTEDVAVETANEPAAAPERAEPRFHCDGRVYCAQMTSCEEATYFLQNCPGVKMDGEGDGVPCERQWCGSH